MVMGAGSIGSLFGAHLAEAGNDVVLVGRKEHVQAIRRNGLEIQGKDVVTRIVKLSSVTSTKQVKGPFDLILLTVKAYDTIKAVLEVQELIDDKTAVLCLQNGLGIEEIVSKTVKNPMRGVTMHASLLLEPGIISHTGFGDTFIGERDGLITKRAKTISDTLSKAGLNTKITGNIDNVVWTKTLINSAINPVGALTGLKNGELLQVPALEKLMTRTIEEGASVADKIGVSLNENLVSLTFKTAKLTSDNKNSMLQDILRKKRTEIDFINGAISEYGRKNQVPTPVNDVLTDLIKALEQKNGLKSEDTLQPKFDGPSRQDFKNELRLLEKRKTKVSSIGNDNA
jgi:2-dehydropantoate 2-reductase